MRVISLINEKGGVGKTTTAVSLSYFLAKLKKKVLLIDLDPQASATSIMGIKAPFPTTRDIFTDTSDAIKTEEYIYRSHGVDVIPSDDRLAGIEMGEIASRTAREFILSKFIKKRGLKYDYILIDCKGSLGLLTINALVASTDYIAIVQSEYLSLEGLPKLLKTVGSLESELDVSPNMIGLLLTMFDSRLKLHQSTLSKIKNSGLKSLLFKTIIRINTDLGRSTEEGIPIGAYKPNCNASKDYMSLSKEVVRRSKKGG